MAKENLFVSSHIKDNTNEEVVNNVVEETAKTAYGYIWSYPRDYNITPSTSGKRPILKYTLDGKLVREFDNLADAYASVEKDKSKHVNKKVEETLDKKTEKSKKEKKEKKEKRKAKEITTHESQSAIRLQESKFGPRNGQ
jgi:MinD-like ATPase involved in chromosome partitioning or flagellar assembly